MRAIEEDEYHFLLECELYTDIRYTFDKLSDILINSSNAYINEQLFTEIMSSDDTGVIKVVSNCILAAFEK